MPTALITGASRGLGRALALALAERGWRLVVDARNAPALEEAAAEVARRGAAGVRAVAGDVADGRHRGELTAAAREAGGADLLVLNAGALGPSPLPPLARLPLEDLRRLLEVNAIAQVALVQEALPLLRPGAAIVGVTSDAAREPYPGWGGYGMSKAALEQALAVLSAEHPELRVVVVDPGDMRTAMHQAAFPGEDIGDRPAPEERVPGLLRLLDERAPSGRYELAAAPVPA